MLGYERVDGCVGEILQGSTEEQDQPNGGSEARHADIQAETYTRLSKTDTVLSKSCLLPVLFYPNDIVDSRNNTQIHQIYMNRVIEQNPVEGRTHVSHQVCAQRQYLSLYASTGISMGGSHVMISLTKPTPRHRYDLTL
jgi:hypothetical protein